jgi:hypothetical protein
MSGFEIAAALCGVAFLRLLRRKKRFFGNLIWKNCFADIKGRGVGPSSSFAMYGGTMRFAKQLCNSLVALAIASSCSPASAAPPAKSLKPGKVTVFYPKQTNDSSLARMLRAPIQVSIDKQAAGAVEIGKPLTVTLPAGSHIVQVSHQGDPLEALYRRPEMPITVSAEKPLYFYVYHVGPGPRLGEVDATTAQSEITGIPAKTVSGTATVFVYWPRGILDFGLFDAIKSDFAIFIDGKHSGAITGGDYLSVQLPAGRHLLEMETGSLFGTKLKQDLILGAGTTHYFLVSKDKYIDMTEIPASEAQPELAGLRRR